MNDQDAGGGIGSDCMPSGHNRTNSKGEVVAAVPVTTDAGSASIESSTSNTQSSSLAAVLTAQQHSPRTSSESRIPRDSSRSESPQRKIEPPVTKSTLSELDVSKIIHNPKLRHDINFDPELHFRPNLDGDKGRKKRDKAEEFWASLRDQLTLFVVDREEFLSRYGQGEDWCLPQLLKAVKDIIQTLVPARDRDVLNEGLNVELLMQQFHRGICDLEKLAGWLSGVLKLHCAPMRDEWVDAMFNELSRGNRTNDMNELVNGMRSLLGVLEAMKLDVANHQIRCLRPVLIEDTVHFEQRFFARKIKDRKMNIAEARTWYQDSLELFLPQSRQSAWEFGELTPFFDALARLMRPGAADSVKIPNTFMFDEERILKLRSDMTDSINLEVCMRFYEQRLASSIWRQSPSLPSYVSDSSEFSTRPSSSEFNFSAPLSGSLSSQGSLSLGHDSANSSPRNSGIFSSPRTSGAFTSHPVDVHDIKAKGRTLYGSLVALLQTAPPSARANERWASLASPAALQIFRYLNLPDSALSQLEQELSEALKVKSELFRHVEHQHFERFLGELVQRVKDFKNLAGVGLFTIATGGRIHFPGRTWDSSREMARNGVDAREEAGVEDMATRLAHLGMLHWRVWGDIAYDADLEMGGMSV